MEIGLGHACRLFALCSVGFLETTRSEPVPSVPWWVPCKQYRVTVPCANRLCDLYTNYTAIMQFAFFAFNKLVCKLAVGARRQGNCWQTKPGSTPFMEPAVALKSRFKNAMRVLD